LSQEFYATGRRKNAVARIYLKSGTGQITVNGKDIKVFFNRETHIDHIVQPLEATSTISKYDVDAITKGGGQTGQAGAMRMGIARALAQIDESLKTTLAKGGFLTRDDRMVERKKYGRMKARRRYQFSKR
jgi:small subunit ribosomal protein S9